MQTEYLDLVYCHDVEFVSAAEVLEAIKELRRIRDEEGTIRYIGISGYPLDVLGDLAELILRETGEPLDAVQSYANFTLQNQELAGKNGVLRLKNAGVDVVPNASILGMGLLRREGIPVGALGDFHPAPSDIREAVRKASEFCDGYGERIEVIAIRFALETWISAGALCGSKGDPASGLPWQHESIDDVGGSKLGVSVIGVSRAEELEKTMLVWRSILDGLEGGQETAVQAGRWYRAWEWSTNRRKAVQILAEGVQEILGKAFGYTWASPNPGYVNKRVKMGLQDDDASASKAGVSHLTPAASPAALPVKNVADVTEDEKVLPLR